jgi:hypothetical protein
MWRIRPIPVLTSAAATLSPAPMNHLTAVCLGVGLLLAAGGLRAQRPAEAVKGKVLVLENQRTITGDIERDGDRYRIRRLTGETSVPAAGVLRLCGSLEEALAFLRSRANLADPDERLRLCEWCRQHGLREQAIAEVDAAQALRPEDVRIRRLLAALIESKKRADAPPVPAAPPPALPRVEVDAETLAAFAVKVQPILMNACASCHSGEGSGAFQLRRPIAPGLTDRRAIDHNLASVAALVDVARPERSKLVIKAVTVHAPGMVHPPLRKTHAAAVKTLEGWAAHLATTLPAAPPPPTTVAAPPPLPIPPIPPTRFGETRTAVVTPPKEAEDPLGPDEFNREFHPKGKPAGPPDR